MRFRVRKPNAKHRAKKLWHNYYALFPKRVPTRGKRAGMTLVWLEHIERKLTYHACITICWIDRDYRFKEGKQWKV